MIWISWLFIFPKKSSVLSGPAIGLNYFVLTSEVLFYGLSKLALVVFSYLSLQLFFLVQGASNVSPIQPSDRSAISNILNSNYHCRCIVTWHFLTANSKLIENLNQAASTRCSGDNKEKLSTNIWSEYANAFCQGSRDPMFTQIQRNCWLETIFQWA